MGIFKRLTLRLVQTTFDTSAAVKCEKEWIMRNSSNEEYFKCLQKMFSTHYHNFTLNIPGYIFKAADCEGKEVNVHYCDIHNIT